MQSPAERLAALSEAERGQFLASLTDKEAEALLSDWRGFLARPEQIAPEGSWEIWLALAGRGWGKTETGAQWIKEREAAGARSIALVAETQKDLEEVMVARIARICPEVKIRYKPVRLTWPSGAVALGYNGTEPNQLRGPEFDTAWVDELAKYRYARETWDMLQFTLRSAGALEPRQLVTTTPRPIEIIKDIVAGKEGRVHVTRGRTSDNRANLAASFLERIEQRYAGTRLGRQELNGEILGDLPGALWTLSSIDSYRIGKKDLPPLGRTVIAVDPAITSDDDSDYHGITVLARAQDEARGFVLEDASLQGTPKDWASRAIALYREHGADAIVAEVNQGGDMVEYTLQTIDPHVKVIKVHAAKGKHVRAEPISALYEQGKIAHVGAFPDLEGQMTQMTTAGYQGDGSPDRVDALVWGFTELFDGMIRAPRQAEPVPRIPRRSGGWMGS